MGQAATQRPQRMQAGNSLARFCSEWKASTPLVPLRMGTSWLKMALPIMGPPMISLSASPRKPPAASTRTFTGVPTRHRKLEGLAMPGPDTVTTRSTLGSPVRTMRQMV